MRTCGNPGCPTLVERGKCTDHGGNQDTHGWDNNRRTDIIRMRGRKLQEARRRLFQRQPMCEVCEKAGRLTLATIRDHRIPLAEGGKDDETNEQALCRPCSDAKTQEEAQRGRGR